MGITEDLFNNYPDLDRNDINCLPPPSNRFYYSFAKAWRVYNIKVIGNIPSAIYVSDTTFAKLPSELTSQVRRASRIKLADLEEEIDETSEEKPEEIPEEKPEEIPEEKPEEVSEEKPEENLEETPVPVVKEKFKHRVATMDPEVRIKKIFKIEKKVKKLQKKQKLIRKSFRS